MFAASCYFVGFLCLVAKYYHRYIICFNTCSHSVQRCRVSTSSHYIYLDLFRLFFSNFYHKLVSLPNMVLCNAPSKHTHVYVHVLNTREFHELCVCVRFPECEYKFERESVCIV